MHALVTGAAGFIGANLCARLRNDPRIASVVAFDDLSTGSLANLEGLGVEFVDGSILDRDAVLRVVERSDVVVHLAAKVSVEASVNDPVATHLVNATGTLNVLEAARNTGSRLVIIASSSAVYGDAQGSPADETRAVQPCSAYGASKAAAEAYALAYQRSFGLPTLVLRLFNVFGPLQAKESAYSAVVPAFISAALEGRPVTMHGEGTQTRDFVYVGDVCAVIQDAIARGISLPTPVNVASGRSISLTELLATLEQFLDRPIERTIGPARSGDLHDSRAEVRELRQQFPGVDMESFAAGLAATVAWARSSAARVNA